jgi:glycerol-3-phosphate O-acyltransferase
MSNTVTLPLWLLILILLFAAVTFASHFLFPSVRWFFRRRMERAVSELNKRLARPIEPFKLARRYDMIQRLIYDPEVTRAIVDYAREERVPENVAFEKARHYAREIVPGFSATAYFTIGTRFAKWVSTTLYRVRLGEFDIGKVEALDRDATVVFVMNHRSNMDYILVGYLMSRASALSYAAGEWARLWPLGPVVRMMGAYFIRRKSRGALYRKVLARYVRMSTEGGVTQAIFPEGGLSLDGRVGPPKLGLLSYMVDGWSEGDRDVIFVPVALNYDRVLEDKFLIKADKSGNRRFKPPMMTIVRVSLRHFWQRLSFRFKPFGTASVGFGEPVRLSEIAGAVPPEQRAEAVGMRVMDHVREVVPVMPVPLVSRVLLARREVARGQLEREVGAMIEGLQGRGLTLPRRAATEVVRDALALLTERKIVRETGDRVAIVEEAEDTHRFYANSIAHHFSASASGN